MSPCGPVVGDDFPLPARRDPAAAKGNRTTSAISDASTPRLHPKQCGRDPQTARRTSHFDSTRTTGTIRYLALRRDRTLPRPAARRGSGREVPPAVNRKIRDQAHENPRTVASTALPTPRSDRRARAGPRRAARLRSRVLPRMGQPGCLGGGLREEPRPPLAARPVLGRPPGDVAVRRPLRPRRPPRAPGRLRHRGALAGAAVARQPPAHARRGDRLPRHARDLAARHESRTRQTPARWRPPRRSPAARCRRRSPRPPAGSAVAVPAAAPNSGTDRAGTSPSSSTGAAAGRIPTGPGASPPQTARARSADLGVRLAAFQETGLPMPVPRRERPVAPVTRIVAPTGGRSPDAARSGWTPTRSTPTSSAPVNPRPDLTPGPVPRLRGDGSRDGRHPGPRRDRLQRGRGGRPPQPTASPTCSPWSRRSPSP